MYLSVVIRLLMLQLIGCGVDNMRTALTYRSITAENKKVCDDDDDDEGHSAADWGIDRSV